MLKHEIDPPVATRRAPFVDALRAGAAALIAWHHFGQYGPEAFGIEEDSRLVELTDDLRLAVHVFFVIGGYVMARSMDGQSWNLRRVGSFVVRRYCRLGLPYLAALALVIGACAMGRGWLPESVLGAPATIDQIAAHVVLLQDILGYESLSTGFWFVAIDFQLGLMVVALLFLRDSLPGSGRVSSGRAAMALGWTLAAASVFYFNLNDAFDVWAVYFFGQFFLGVMVYEASKSRPRESSFWLYVAMILAALAVSWRWQLATSLTTALTLLAASKSGLLERWPTSRTSAHLGRTSYSLFLVHFPVLLVVLTLCMRSDWTSPGDLAVALVAAFAASLAVAEVFYYAVEAPAERLCRRFS